MSKRSTPQPELGPDWSWLEKLGELEIALPDEPQRLELPTAGAARLLIADEYGDAFGVLDGGTHEHVAWALGRALDQLYGVEWGTSDAPEIDATSERATFEGFGEDYVAVWRRTATAVLLAVTRPEREDRARAFVGGSSVRG